MPPLEIQVFSPSSTQASPSSRAVQAMAATSEPAPGSLSAKAVMHSPRATRGSTACCSAVLPASVIGPLPRPCIAKAKSARPSCRDSVSRQTTSARESSVSRGTAEGRRHAMAQHAGLAERRHQPSAGGVGVVVVQPGQGRGAPGVEIAGKVAVRLVEEREVEVVETGHRDSWRTACIVRSSCLRCKANGRATIRS
jgi:hypothetical protein